MGQKIGMLLLLLLANMTAMAQLNLLTSRSSFPLLQFDTLHIHTRIASSPSEQSDAPAHRPEGPLEIPVARFWLDEAGQFEGFLLRSHDFRHLWLYVFDANLQRLIGREEVAHYKYLAGAMESTLNSWLMDMDGDGTKEILIVENLRDFEFPTEEAPNISGTKKRYLTIEKEKLKYHDWPANLDLPGTMKK